MNIFEKYQISAKSTIFFLTGAGLDAESGIKTFRASDGLWEGHDVTAVAHPDGFAKDRDLVYSFYNERRKQLLSPATKPNAEENTVKNATSVPNLMLSSKLLASLRSTSLIPSPALNVIVN